jgi:hypothetical protein
VPENKNWMRTQVQIILALHTFFTLRLFTKRGFGGLEHLPFQHVAPDNEARLTLLRPVLPHLVDPIVPRTTEYSHLDNLKKISDSAYGKETKFFYTQGPLVI